MLVEAQLFVARLYVLRALRLRAAGLPDRAIEECTGIPRVCLNALLPRLLPRKSASPSRLTEQASRLTEEELREITQARYDYLMNRNWLGPFQQKIGREASPDGPPKSSAGPTRPDSILEDLGWTGVADEPLPLQSSVSLAQRFLDLNCVSWQIARQSSGFSITKTRGFFARQIGVDFACLPSDSAWRCTADRKLITSLPHVTGLLFSAPFRFCVACLREGYHSVLHQLALVARCPIHDDELVTSCVHCGALTECVERQLSCHASGYLCNSCEAPLCGDVPRLEVYAPGCDTFQKMEWQLSPWTRWLEICQQRLWSVEQILQQNARSVVHWSRWTDIRELLLDAVQVLHPLPVSPSDRRIRVVPLRWSFRIAGDTSIHRSQASQRHLPGGIYESTIRALRNSNASSDERMRAVVKLLRTGRRLDTTNVDLRDLALYLLRVHCESEVDLPAPQTKMPLSSQFLAPLVHRTVRRLPLRAVLLSTYAALLSGLVREFERTGFISSECLNLLPSGGTVPFALLPELNTATHSLQYSEGIALAVNSENFDACTFWPKGSG